MDNRDSTDFSVAQRLTATRAVAAEVRILVRTLPSSVNTTLHPRWDRIVGKCMETSPTQRYQDFREIGDALMKAQRPVAGVTF